MLDLPPGAVPEEGFDIIVANPPYVAEHERDTLPEHVLAHEPHVALFSGPDGLEAFRRIAGGVRNLLRPSGTVILEVGHAQADAVEQIMTTTGRLDVLGRYKDLNGIDRAVQLTLST